MKKQLDFLKDIIELKNQNPDADIVFCVDPNEILEDSSWTAHKITKVKLNKLYEDGENIIADEDQIKDHLGFLLALDVDSDEELVELVNKCYEKNTKMAICVYTSAY